MPWPVVWKMTSWSSRKISPPTLKIILDENTVMIFCNVSSDGDIQSVTFIFKAQNTTYQYMDFLEKGQITATGTETPEIARYIS